MNHDLLESLMAELRKLPASDLIGDTHGTPTYRTNDIGGDYFRRAEEMKPQTLALTTGMVTDHFNMLIGAGTTERGDQVKGIAGMLVTLAPEAARDVLSGQLAEHKVCTMADIAIALTGIDDARAHILVLGPNWAGGMCAWITPNEAAEAVSSVIVGCETVDIWAHLDREAIQQLEKTFKPLGRARTAAAERVAAASAHEQSVRMSAEMARLGDEYPATWVFETTDIDPTARLDDGTIIGKTCKIGPGAHIEPDVRLGERANIGANVRIGKATTIENGVTIRDGATIGHNCRLGAANVIEAGATLQPHVTTEGEAVIGEGATIEDGVDIAFKARIGSGTVIERDASIDYEVVIGPKVRIGELCRIAKGTCIEGADMPALTVLAAGLKITTWQQMRRYALRVTPAPAPAESKAQELVS